MLGSTTKSQAYPFVISYVSGNGLLNNVSLLRIYPQHLLSVRINYKVTWTGSLSKHRRLLRAYVAVLLHLLGYHLGCYYNIFVSIYKKPVRLAMMGEYVFEQDLLEHQTLLESLKVPSVGSFDETHYTQNQQQKCKKQ